MADFNFIVRLPTSLSCVVLNDWLDLASIGRLDSAFCNHYLRIELLDLFHWQECMINCRWWPVNNALSIWRWILGRNIKVSHILVTQDTMHKAAMYVAQHAFVVSVAMHVAVAQDACSINHLTFQRDIACRLPSIQQLSFYGEGFSQTPIDGSQAEGNDQLVSIIVNCIDVRSLRLCAATVMQLTYLLLASIRNVQLVHLDLQGTKVLIDECLLVIGKSIVNLRSINLQNCCRLSNKAVRQFVKCRSTTLEVLFAGHHNCCYAGISRELTSLIPTLCPRLRTLCNAELLPGAHVRCWKYNDTIIAKLPATIYRRNCQYVRADFETVHVLDLTDLSGYFERSVVPVLLKDLIAFMNRCIVLREVMLPNPQCNPVLLARLKTDFPQLQYTTDASKYQYDLYKMLI